MRGCVFNLACILGHVFLVLCYGELSCPVDIVRRYFSLSTCEILLKVENQCGMCINSLLDNLHFNTDNKNIAMLLMMKKSATCEISGFDLLLSMETLEPDGGSIVAGDGFTAALTGYTNYGKPTQVDNGHCGKGLFIDRGQYIEFVGQNGNCLGNLDHCSNGMTVTMWIKWIDTYQSYPHYIFSNVHTFDQGSSIMAYLDPVTTTVGVVSWSKAHQRKYEFAGGHLANFKSWHHIAFTVHPERGHHIYFDGTLIASKTTFVSFSPSDETDDVVWIGKGPYGASSSVMALDAELDDVSILMKQLTDQQIHQLYLFGTV